MSAPVVLVHGGGHGAWCWEATVAEMASAVLAVDLPPVSIRGGAGRLEHVPECDTLTLADFADAVLDGATASGWDRVVLVAHSLGGATIAEVARRSHGRVAGLVFVSAVVPEEGGTVLEMLPAGMLERLAGGLTEEAVRDMFCTGMTEEQTRFVLDNVGTEVIGVMTQRVSRQGAPTTVPVTFVRLARDNALPPATQDACIARLGREFATVDVVDIDAGHNVMITAPATLAAVLDAVASNAG
ncbi:MAG: alpha/beta fold hydrolase [Acidimicrobiales bacterium]